MSGFGRLFGWFDMTWRVGSTFGLEILTSSVNVPRPENFLISLSDEDREDLTDL